MGGELPGPELERLRGIAAEIRRDLLHLAYTPPRVDPAFSLSAADLLTVLLFREMRLDPERPGWADRDRLLLSELAGLPALLAALARRGYFPPPDRSEPFPGAGRDRPPGVEIWPVGHGDGIGLAAGLALDEKIRGRSPRIFVMISVAELHDGSSWAGLAFAAEARVPNLIVLVVGGGVPGVVPVDLPAGSARLPERLRVAGFDPVLVDGHDLSSLSEVLSGSPASAPRPRAIEVRAVPGRGVRSLEEWNASGRSACPELTLERVLAELQDGAGP